MGTNATVPEAAKAVQQRPCRGGREAEHTCDNRYAHLALAKASHCARLGSTHSAELAKLEQTSSTMAAQTSCGDGVVFMFRER